MGLGFDPLELPADRFFNWVWSVVMRNRDDKDRSRLIGELYLPLPGQRAEVAEVAESGPWSRAEMAKSFRSMQAQLAGGTS